MDPKLVEMLVQLMDQNNNGVIDEAQYQMTMRAWSSFSATDINNDNELDMSELKTLIWLTSGEEPDDLRVQRDLKCMDEDKSGTIDRIEWVSYLSSPAGK